MAKSQEQITRRTALVSLTAALAAAAPRQLPIEVLSAFGNQGREKLLQVVGGADYRGRIGPDAVQTLLGFENRGLDDLMLALLPLARLGSHAPLSNYHVGAVIQGASKSLYLGANIEAPGQVLGLAVHGEQSAIANAYMYGETGITTLAVTAAPCGHCRQFLNEISPDGRMRILLTGAAPTSLAVLLPRAFGPKDLGQTQGAMPIRETLMSLKTAEPLAVSALDSARKAYSPYTRSPSGVAVILSSRRIFSGSYIENVAFNPSLSPLQTALAGLFAAGESPASIVRAVLVESADARISQKASTQATLAAISPSARLEVLVARRTG